MVFVVHSVWFVAQILIGQIFKHFFGVYTLISAPERSSLDMTSSSSWTSGAKVILAVWILKIRRFVYPKQMKYIINNFRSHLIRFMGYYVCTNYNSSKWHTFSSGKGNSIFRSIRPGRIKAGSKVSILLVAITTFTSPELSNPSNWFSNSNIVLWISRSPPEFESYRFVPTASISSIKTIEGACSSATRNSSRTNFGPSP